MNNTDHLKTIKLLVAAGHSYKEYVETCKVHSVTPCHEKFYK